MLKKLFAKEDVTIRVSIAEMYMIIGLTMAGMYRVVDYLTPKIIMLRDEGDYLIECIKAKYLTKRSDKEKGDFEE